jgi:CLIP-associating protein 1/2
VGTTDSERIEELKRHISALSCGDADTTVLKRLVIICIENSVEVTPASRSSPIASNHPTSPSPLTPSQLPPSLHSDMWETNRLFEQFFNALNTYLEPSRVCPRLAISGIFLTE